MHFINERINFSSYSGSFFVSGCTPELIMKGKTIISTILFTFFLMLSIASGYK